FAVGSPARATIGNFTFGLTVTGNAPNALCFYLGSLLPTSIPLNGACTLYADPSLLLLTVSVQANGAGVANLPLPIPNAVELEGGEMTFQTLEYAPGNGMFANTFDLGNGLRVRIGNNLVSCP